MEKLFTDTPCPIPGDEVAYGLFQQVCRNLDAVPEAQRAEAGSRLLIALLLRLLDALSPFDAMRLAGAVLLTAKMTLGGRGQPADGVPPGQVRH